MGTLSRLRWAGRDKRHEHSALRRERRLRLAKDIHLEPVGAGFEAWTPQIERIYSGSVLLEKYGERDQGSSDDQAQDSDRKRASADVMLPPFPSREGGSVHSKKIGLAVAVYLASSSAMAQANANATRDAGDAFGFRSGDDSVGIYDESSVRGFNLEAAGNYRINGSYFVRNSGVSSFFLGSTTVRIGYNTLGSVLPGPSGVVDYRLRDPLPDEPSSLTLGVDPHGQTYTDLLIKHRSLDERLSFSAGIGRIYEVHDQQGGEGGGSWLFAGAGRLTLGSLTARAFMGEYEYERPGQFRIRPGSDSLPPEIARERFLGQEWVLDRGQRRIAGVLLDSTAGGQAGIGATLVFSQEDPNRAYTQIFDDFLSDGTVRSLLAATPRQRSNAWSTEIRSYWGRSRENWSERVDLTLRGRRSRARFGGTQVADLGRVTFGQPAGPVDPPAELGETTATLQDAVDQWGLGLSYRAQLGERLKLNLGVLRTDYKKTVGSASTIEPRSQTKPWLYNAGVAWRIDRHMELYGSASRGLEEAGVAPATAANANEVLNAIEVTQRELGIRHAPSGGGALVLAAFDTQKPYAGLDESNGAYRSIGQVRHRGFETSFSGNVAPGLKVVLGAVYLDAQLNGPGVEQGHPGGRPVGVPQLRAIANADYEVPTVPGLSFDVAAAYTGERAVRTSRSASTGKQLETGAVGNLNMGVRYRFAVGALRMTVRAQVLNATDVFEWEPSSAETLNYSGPRRFKLALTAEY